ncbi:MAG: hypothetical protein ABI380_07175 [Edaphobacter sp.]
MRITLASFKASGSVCLLVALFSTCPPFSSAQSAAAPALTALPGKGLAQHPFLYCGEWNYTSPLQTMYLVRNGKVAWSYSIPLNVTVYGKPDKEEFSDCTRLSNGNILFSRRFGASEITPAKKMIWNYDAPIHTEVHSAQAVGKDRVLLTQNGNPAKLLLINIRTNKVEKELVLPTAHPDQIHGQFRRAHMTRSGTFLVAHMDLNKVVEYDSSGKEIWSTPSPSPWDAVRLKNGNTLVSGNQYGFVREIDPKGKTVWEVTKDELPGFPLDDVQGVSRLANGNTLISNWVSGNTKPADWPSTVQFVEVTPAKKVVWALRQWNNPNLGPASSIQLLDQPGIPENGDLKR